MSSVGQALRDRRQDTIGGETERLGLDPDAVRDIEAGAFERVSFASVERYCEAIGLDIELKEHVR